MGEQEVPAAEAMFPSLLSLLSLEREIRLMPRWVAAVGGGDGWTRRRAKEFAKKMGNTGEMGETAAAVGFLAPLSLRRDGGRWRADRRGLVIFERSLRD
jgi:hypothetical protein